MSAYAPAIDDKPGMMQDMRRRPFLNRRSDTPRGSSYETKIIAEMLKKALADFAFPVTQQDFEITEIFLSMATRWREETMLCSSISKNMSNRWYLEIIALGKPAVALIIYELENNPDYWFAALREITGQDPVRPEHKGYFELMRRDWLQWAEREGNPS